VDIRRSDLSTLPHARSQARAKAWEIATRLNSRWAMSSIVLRCVRGAELGSSHFVNPRIVLLGFCIASSVEALGRQDTTEERLRDCLISPLSGPTLLYYSAHHCDHQEWFDSNMPSGMYRLGPTCINLQKRLTVFTNWLVDATVPALAGTTHNADCGV
jgi:hypothetical protein